MSRGFGARPSRRGLAWSVGALVALTLGVVAIVGPATAAPSKKNYTTSFSPLFAGAGTTSNYTLTLANDPSSNQTLGSANFQVPAGTTVNSATNVVASGGQTGWSVRVDGSVVEFRSAGSKDSLLPGQSVSVVLNVTSPSSSATCPAADYVWDSGVKQSNDFSGTGNDFALKGTDATLTVAKLVFTTEPPAQVKVAPDSFGTTVTAEGLCGNTLTSATDTVSLTLATNPLNASLGGTTSAALSGGVASFSGLTIDTVGTGYQLGASVQWGDTTNTSSATSTAIDVLNTLCTARNCHAQDDPNTPTTLVDSVVPNGAQLGVGFPKNISFSCNNSSTPVGSFVLIDPSNYAAGTLYTVTLTIKKSASGTGPAASFVVCINKSNGSGAWTQLPDCATTDAHPCVVSKKRTTLGDLQIVLRFDPADPTGGVS